jgi:hypothetical protein
VTSVSTVLVCYDIRDDRKIVQPEDFVWAGDALSLTNAGQKAFSGPMSSGWTHYSPIRYSAIV